MRKQPNERFIGLFMIGGLLTLLLMGAVFLSERLFLNDGRMLVMYFEESINGLSVGSPVVFKGVQIGKVTAIDLIANAETLEFSIPVYVRLEKRRNIENGEFVDRERILEALIDKGLRARLATQSYLTGMLMVELEMLPGTPIVLRHPAKDKNIFEIPTVLSPLSELSKGLQDLPLKESVAAFNKFFTTLNTELPNILPQISQAATRLNKAVSNNLGATAETLNNFNQTMLSVEAAANSMRNLTDYLERHPEAILKGKERGK